MGKLKGITEQKSSNPNGWRREGDSNSRPALNRLPHFECGPFDHLGISPYLIYFYLPPEVFRISADISGRHPQNKNILFFKKPVISIVPRQFKSSIWHLMRMISSRSRYDHFDSPPHIFQPIILNVSPKMWRQQRTNDRKHNI